MVYIKNIGKYIPENYLDNLSEAELNGKGLNWLTNSIGILNTPKKSSKESVLSMCINAYNDLKILFTLVMKFYVLYILKRNKNKI